MEHTPGPWERTSHQRASLAEASIEVQSATGRTICDMGDYPNSEDAANARLIAAAPDMLAALRRYIRLDDDHRAGCEIEPEDWAECHEAAIDAIAKTRGS